MNVFRRVVRLIKTLLMIPVLLVLKVISAIAVLFAVLIEGIGFTFFGTLFGRWMLSEMSKKVSYMLLFAEESQLWILQQHIIANQKFLRKLGTMNDSLPVNKMIAWSTDVPTPKIDPSQVN